MELLSTIRGGKSLLACASVSCKAALSSGRPSARNPCLVLSQSDRRVRAARKRARSVPVSACVSQLIAQTCSSGAQPQFSSFCAQTPCPYWVIFPAIQFAGRNAEITSHTSCVLPMLRVCPPTTIRRHWAGEFLSFAAKLFLYSFDARGQLREPAIPCEQLFEFLQRTSRCSPNCLPAANGFSTEHAALPADYCAILKLAPLAKACLPAHSHVLSKYARAGQTHLSRNHRVRPDLTVVPHVREIVQLHAFRDAGVVE